MPVSNPLLSCALPFCEVTGVTVGRSEKVILSAMKTGAKPQIRREGLRGMKKEDVHSVIEELLKEIEEEDIGISLFSTFYQIEEDLNFFKPETRKRVESILLTLVDDSKRHKTIIAKLIHLLEKKIHEK